MTAAALILFATIGGSQAQAAPVKQPVKQWVWLQSQGVWGYGYQLEEGPHRGLWRIDEGTKRPPSDPYGFGEVLNRYRAAAGLPPASYDAGLSNWASLNNATQSCRGIGHHVTPNCHQNCGWNMTDAESAAAEWMNSPGHRDNMLLPGMTHFGIAYGPGPYWTLNVR